MRHGTREWHQCQPGFHGRCPSPARAPSRRHALTFRADVIALSARPGAVRSVLKVLDRADGTATGSFTTRNRRRQIMALRINSEAPNFTADTTQGKITFHDWIGS